MPRALLLTVGTGDAAELETSLFAPLLLSIRQGDWGRVVLLPSLVTAPNADEVRRRLDAKVISIAPLPVRGAENDADACFDHFDRVIETLLAAGQAPADVVADFTRGTKAMSAALVLAAIRHGVPVLRYVAGQQRDQRGMAVAGSEHLRETRIARATARRRLDLARGLAEHASFGAALSLLPDPDNRLAALGWDTAEREALRALRPLVAFLAAWDRLDYAGAATIVLPAPEALPAAWRRHYPPAAVKHLVIRLAQWPRSDRLIAIDLLANAERRVTQGQYEDALVRVYNVVERIARARLADAGGGNEGRARNMDALEQRRDPLVPNLRALDRAHPSLQPAARNDSILVHGHAAPGSASPGNWPALLGAIGDVLRRDAALRGDTGALDRDLAAARFPMTWNEA